MNVSRLFIALTMALVCVAARAQQPTTVSITLTTTWTDTGVALTSGETVKISATGQMNWFTGGCSGCISSPDGNPCPYAGFAVPDLACWSLIGKIGENGTPFQVGTRLDISKATAGELFLGVNDNNYPDNTGSWVATINESGKQGNCNCPGSEDTTGVQSNGTDAVGAPIDLASGNMSYDTTDYTTSGQNPLQFTRFYNSRGNISGSPTLASSLGMNWRSTFDRYLQLSSTTVIAERANGEQLTFTAASGKWTPDTDVDFTLTDSGSTWTLTTHEDTIETYSAVSATEALLTSLQFRNGYAQYLNYNSSYQLTSVTDGYGRSLNLTYSSGGTIATLTTADNTAISYGYTPAIASGTNLTSVTFPTSPESTVTYLYTVQGQPNQLTGVEDENHNVYTTWKYDPLSRGTNSFHGPLADATVLTFNKNATVTVTNALNVPETYTFSTLQGLLKVTAISRAKTATTAAALRALTYDTKGYLASATDWNGNKTTYVNDTHGNPLTINEAVGTLAARTTTITYDSTWVHLPKTIVTPGLTVGFTYDGNGDVLTRTLTDTTTTTSPYSTKGQTRTWTYTWSNSLLASVTTPLKHTTTFTYNSSGALIKVVNPLEQPTNITSSSPGGYPETILDPNNVTTRLSYDARQNLTKSAVSTRAGNLATEFTHDAAENLIGVTLPDGSALDYQYDTAHRLTGITDKLGNKIDYTLDALGDKTNTDIYAKGETTPDAAHSASFDALGRILTDVGVADQITTYTHDNNGNLLTILDPLKNETTRVFDALNRLTQVTDANKGITLVAYDAHDRPTKVTDANDNSTTFVYDGFGEVIQQTSPDSGISVYKYDPDGNLLQKTDALGVVTNHAYDALDRPSSTTYPADAAEDVGFTYDQAGHGFGIGRLTSVTDAAGSLSRTYDERGNLLTETRVNGSTTLKTAYTYDPASRIASMAYPDRTLVRYTRDAMGQIAGVTATLSGGSATTLLSGVTHLPFGPMSAANYGNGIAETWGFDTNYRATGINDVLSGKNVQDLAYGYDLDNNVKSITDAVNVANTQTLAYDPLNRLSSAASGAGGYGSYAWKYDNVGNRTLQTENSTTTNYKYTPGTNRLATILSGASSTTIATNANGNITSIPPANSSTLATFAYNKANRLSSVTGSPVGAAFLYDWQGQRFSKTDAGSKPILFSYMQGGTLISENDNGSVSDYVYADGRPIADLQQGAKTVADQVNYLLADHLGTPQLAVNSSGTTVWQTAYQPFGTTGNVAGSITQNLRFPGQYADTETGFSYNLNRDYMPNMGRYFETDPIGLAGGLNSYAYGNANPELFSDRYGKVAGVDDGPEAVVVGGAIVVYAGYLVCKTYGPPILRWILNNDEAGSGSGSGSSSSSGSGASSGSGSGSSSSSGSGASSGSGDQRPPFPGLPPGTSVPNIPGGTGGDETSGPSGLPITPGPKGGDGGDILPPGKNPGIPTVR